MYVTDRSLTIDEFERLDTPEGQRTELVRGLVVREPPAGWDHGQVGFEITRRIADHARTRGLGKVANADTGYILHRDAPTVRAPDAGFVAAARLTGGPIPGFFPRAPDLAVEVVSPSDGLAAVHEKVLDYLDAGTRAVWVVEPRTRTVTVFRSRSDIVVLRETDALDGGDVLPGFRVSVGELFDA